MKLDCDPTVIYVLKEKGSFRGRLLKKHLKLESPYNTYRNLGLPPSPICSPGLASMQASAYPADTDYFYFLADCTKNDGSHIFAVTEEEHLNNYAVCGGGVP